MSVRQPTGVLYSFSIKNIFFDKWTYGFFILMWGILYFIQIWLNLSFSEFLPIEPYATTILNKCPWVYKQRQSYYKHIICRVYSELKIFNPWLKFKEIYYREIDFLWIIHKELMTVLKTSISKNILQSM